MQGDEFGSEPRHGSDRARHERSPFWFAKAAESQWIVYELDRMAAKYASHGHVDFRVRDEVIVGVGDGYSEFHLRGKGRQGDQGGH